MSNAARSPAWGHREQRLLARARIDRDRGAMDLLVRHMAPLARRLARKYQRPPEPLDDLLQVAHLGLFQALRRFDPARGVDFHAFAIPTITGELKRYRRDFCWSVRVPRPLQERVLRVTRQADLLSGELGRSPTVSELAARCELSAREVLEAQHAAGAYRAASLDDERGDDPQPAPAVDDPGYQLVEERDMLRFASRVLQASERRILHLRLQEDLIQSEIAQRIGASQTEVSRRLRQAYARIAEVLADNDQALPANGAPDG
jgi:RNA polymerase sigma-B factor